MNEIILHCLYYITLSVKMDFLDDKIKMKKYQGSKSC